MHQQKRILPFLLALLFVLSLVPAAGAESGEPADLPRNGDYVLRINGGYVSEHTETVNGKTCLRVDLFLDGVTSERLLSSISVNLQYDADTLTLEKYKSLSGNGVMSTLNPNEPGLIRYAFISSNGSLLNGTKPLLTLWFAFSEDLPAGTQIRFAISGPVKADSVPQGSYASEKRTVGVQLRPFGIGPIYGDANCDCEVTAADAALVLRALVGLDTLSERGTENAKVGGEAAFSAQDAALILRYVVGLIERFPADK